MIMRFFPLLLSKSQCKWTEHQTKNTVWRCGVYLFVYWQKSYTCFGLLTTVYIVHDEHSCIAAKVNFSIKKVPKKKKQPKKRRKCEEIRENKLAFHSLNSDSYGSFLSFVVVHSIKTHRQSTHALTLLDSIFSHDFLLYCPVSLALSFSLSLSFGPRPFHFFYFVFFSCTLSGGNLDDLYLARALWPAWFQHSRKVLFLRDEYRATKKEAKRRKTPHLFMC